MSIVAGITSSNTSLGADPAADQEAPVVTGHLPDTDPYVPTSEAAKTLTTLVDERRSEAGAQEVDEIFGKGTAAMQAKEDQQLKEELAEASVNELQKEQTAMVGKTAQVESLKAQADERDAAHEEAKSLQQKIAGGVMAVGVGLAAVGALAAPGGKRETNSQDTDAGPDKQKIQQLQERIGSVEESAKLANATNTESRGLDEGAVAKLATAGEVTDKDVQDAEHAVRVADQLDGIMGAEANANGKANLAAATADRDLLVNINVGPGQEPANRELGPKLDGLNDSIKQAVNDLRNSVSLAFQDMGANLNADATNLPDGQSVAPMTTEGMMNIGERSV